MAGPRYTPLVDSLPSTVPFVGPEAQERARGAAFAARIGANESRVGPSPKAVAAMQAAATEVWMYGDPDNHDLRMALGAHHGIDPRHVIVGEGIDGLLGNLVRLVISQGDVVVTSEGAYPTFNFHVQGYGGQLHKVPYTGDHEDPEALITAARDTGAKLIYFANPDNPMASIHTPERVQAMVEQVPEGCLLVLDEAYIELAPKASVPIIDPEDPRVIRMRTFSKGYGLAGARVGYAIGAKPLIASFDKVRNHFGLSRVSQAGALAALHDQDWLVHVQTEVGKARDEIARIGRAQGLVPLPSATNFVTMDCGHDGAFARAVVAALGRAGVFIRMPFVAPHDRCIRISAGLPEDLALFEAALPQALAEARAACAIL